MSCKCANSTNTDHGTSVTQRGSHTETTADSYHILHGARSRDQGSGSVLAAFSVALLATLLAVASTFFSPLSMAQDCPQGTEANSEGVCLAKIESETDTDRESSCAEGERLNEAGIFCVPIPPEELSESAGSCDEGYVLAQDGQTCVADIVECPKDRYLDDNGKCVLGMVCPEGMVMSSDRLVCQTGRCPEGEVLSPDRKRCIAPPQTCPDGSPRPETGACLVVERVRDSTGKENVVVRCAKEDTYCQARMRRCAQARAAGLTDEDCNDASAVCSGDKQTCADATERLKKCADMSEEEASTLGSDEDPCATLCPALHRLSPSGECVEYLDPTHACVIYNKVPPSVTTNAQLENYSYLVGLSQCVTKAEFLRRLGNFEAAAEAEADAIKVLRETTSDYISIESTLVEKRSELQELEAQIEGYATQVAQASSRNEELETILEATQKELAQEVENLKVEAVQVFITGDPRIALESAVLYSSNITEISAAGVYGRAFVDTQVGDIERIKELEAEQNRARLEIVEIQAAAQSALESARGTQEEVSAILESLTELRVQQNVQREREAEIVAGLRDDKAQHAQTLGVFERESKEIAAIVAESEFLEETFGDFDGLLANPVIPAKVGSRFGPRLHPILGYVRMHNGLDLTGDFGDKIFATADGVVRVANNFGGYGKTVVIDHGGGLLTLSAHMSAINVDIDEEVSRGDIIGLVGSTGLSTGPHLHFEVWVEGETPVDPTPYLTDLET